MSNNFFPILLFSAVMLIGVGGFAYADTITLTNPLCLEGAGSQGCVETFGQLAEKIIDYLLTVAGALAVLMLVVAGIFFVVSAGDPGRVGQARKIAIYAAVGLVIALGGRGLIAVINQVIGE